MQYISDFQNKVNLLEDTGIEIPEELKTIMLLTDYQTYSKIFVLLSSQEIKFLELISLKENCSKKKLEEETMMTNMVATARARLYHEMRAKVPATNTKQEEIHCSLKDLTSMKS